MARLTRDESRAVTREKLIEAATLSLMRDGYACTLPATFFRSRRQTEPAARFRTLHSAGGGGSPLHRDGVIVGAIGISGGNVETETALAADASAIDK